MTTSSAVTPQGRVHLIDEGDGPALFFLHGLFFTAELAWRPLIDVMRSDFRCVAPDLPGHGGTPADDHDLSMDGLARWACDVSDALNIERCHIIGFSLGGFLAQRIAAWRPETIQSAFLIGSTPFAEPTWFRRYHMNTTVRALRGEVCTDYIRSVLRRKFFGRDFRRKSDRLESILDTLMDFDPEVRARGTAAVLTRPDCLREAQSIRQPITFVRGESDRVRSKSEFRTIRRLFPHAAWDIENSGHSASIEQPGQVLGRWQAHYSRFQSERRVHQ